MRIISKDSQRSERLGNGGSPLRRDAQRIVDQEKGTRADSSDTSKGQEPCSAALLAIKQGVQEVSRLAPDRPKREMTS
jgi:hypothetical protein